MSAEAMYPLPPVTHAVVLFSPPADIYRDLVVDAAGDCEHISLMLARASLGAG
jgi:hypothetical protein